jgi:hypothetical protein
MHEIIIVPYRRVLVELRTGFACKAAACLSTVIAVSKYGSNLGPIASAMSPKHAKMEIFTFRFRTSLDKFSSRTVTNACAYCSVWSPSARVMSPMMPTATVQSCVSSYALRAGYRNGKERGNVGSKLVFNGSRQRANDEESVF